MPLTSKKSFICLPLVQEFLKNTGGDAAIGVATFCEKKDRHVTDEELAKKMKELYLAEEEKNTASSARILRECQAINKEIKEIKRSRLSSI